MRQRTKIADALLAYYPEEVLELYAAGKREFLGVNLLRRELETVFGDEHQFECAGHPDAGRPVSPLWLDYLLGAGAEDFEWDSYGRCVSVRAEDLPEERDLARADLCGSSFQGAYLYPVNFSGANLADADFRQAIVLDSNFCGADLSRCDLRDARFQRCDFSDANFYMARMDRCQIVGEKARRANFKRTKLKKAILVGLDLRDAVFDYARFDLTILNGSDLRGINLSRTDLKNVTVHQAQIDHSQRDALLAALDVIVSDEV